MAIPQKSGSITVTAKNGTEVGLNNDDMAIKKFCLKFGLTIMQYGQKAIITNCDNGRIEIVVIMGMSPCQDRSVHCSKNCRLKKNGESSLWVAEFIPGGRVKIFCPEDNFKITPL